MEAQPRVLKYEGEKVHDILHAWGTNGIITRIWLALAPAVDWAQCAIAFDIFDAAFTFAETIANSERMDEAPRHRLRMADSFFLCSGEASRSRRQSADLLYDRRLRKWMHSSKLAMQSGGDVTFSGAHPSFKTVPLLSDYTWNHTTLWAIRADDSYTYLQCGFDPVRVQGTICRAQAPFWR